MGRVEPGGEPCAEVDQRGRISPDRPLDRGSAALSARDKSADMPASYGGSSEEQGFGCRPSPCGKYRLKFLKDNQIIYGNPADTIEGPIREQREPAILLKTEYKALLQVAGE